MGGLFGARHSGRNWRIEKKQKRKIEKQRRKLDKKIISFQPSRMVFFFSSSDSFPRTLSTPLFSPHL